MRRAIISTHLIYTLFCFSSLSVYAAEVTTAQISQSLAPSASIVSDVTPTSSSSPAPSPTVTDPEISVMKTRRVSQILASLERPTDVPAWMSTLDSEGKWPDNEVDYATGCAARRANWPAQVHWQRILLFAGAYLGLDSGSQFKGDPVLFEATLKAIDYWFGRDLTNYGCLKDGGTNACPCDNVDNSLWNTNWYSNVILIPSFVGRVCLLLEEFLNEAQLSKCHEIPARAFAFFYANPKPGFVAGANILDIAKIGIDLGLLSANTTLLRDAFSEFHGEMVIHNHVKADGIRADGAFAQHAGIIYNGNYGKDYVNAILDVELNAANTSYSANAEARHAFETLIDADRWMVVRSLPSNKNHWDLSVLNRFISFPVIDGQATSSIKISLDAVLELGKSWASAPVTLFAETLKRDAKSANAGDLRGNRMFFTNDYMVHRGPNYVSTIKMFSSRTLNTECVNTQNRFGFHLSDGAQYTYLVGNEYEDIAAAWDWHLIPGTTTDYASTNLSCPESLHGGIESLVGGVSDGTVGIASMRYTNPYTRSLSWRKAWFFIDDDVQHVTVSGLVSTTDATLLTNLDQKRRSGEVWVDGVERTEAGFEFGSSEGEGEAGSWLWHAGVGYVFPSFEGKAKVVVETANKTGDWSAIGTSTQPAAPVELFTASIEHQHPQDPLAGVSPISYTALLGTSTPDAFRAKRDLVRVKTVQNDERVSAIYDERNDVLYATFWEAGGGTIVFRPTGSGPTSAQAGRGITLTATGTVSLIYRVGLGKITVADPSQTLQRATITILRGLAPRHSVRISGRALKVVEVEFPQGGMAGSSVTRLVG